MRPETEAKIIVSFLISLIAFGCGSGLGIAIGLSGGDITSVGINNTSSNDNVQLTPSSTNHLPLNGIKEQGREVAENGNGEVNVVNNQGSSNNTTY
ncbi:MAG: hypothetical protein NQU45_01085 [Methanothermobacter sp.]|nr:hypothetical protein [Methanothermobacter sp.]